MDEINGEFPADRRGIDYRRERRNQSRSAHRHKQPDLWNAILDVDKARTVMVIKRSMGGLCRNRQPALLSRQNPVLFGDAKTFVGAIRPASFPAAEATVSSMLRLPHRPTTPARRRATSGCTRDTAATTRF